MDAEKVREAPHSRFGPREKFVLVLVCASTGFFSTIAGAIYYPALNTIEGQFHISTELVNVSIVLYFLFQGLSPTLMGGLADSFGRRPVVLWSVALYMAACIGIACSKTYAQILVLRCLQSAGISPVIAVNSGIMGDVTTREQRGGYVGLTAGFQVIGSAFGALIGGGIVSTWSWRAVFWFLAIASGFSLVVTFIMLPETKRSIVGNGSIQPNTIWHIAPVLMLPKCRHRLHLDDPDSNTLEPSERLNLLAPITLFVRPEIALLLIVTGLQFSLWVCHLTAMASLLEKNYHLTVAKVGLCYLPSGLCSLVSVVGAGRILNWNYKRRHAIFQKFINTSTQQLLLENDNDSDRVEHILHSHLKYAFNIFRARLEIIFAPLLLSGAAFIAFGWCLDVHAPLATVLVFSGVASLFSNCVIACATTLVVDLYPKKSSTATGCVNFARCIMAAILVAALSSMMSAMSVGGTFTFLAALTISSTTLLIIPIKYGLKMMYRRKMDEDSQTTEQSSAQRPSSANSRGSATDVSQDLPST